MTDNESCEISLTDTREICNVQEINYGIDTILKLQPRSFEWRKGSKKRVKKMDLGFVAQELEKSVPEAVFSPNDKPPPVKPLSPVVPRSEARRMYNQEVAKRKENKLGVYNNMMIPVLVKAFQEFYEEFHTTIAGLTFVKDKEEDLPLKKGIEECKAAIQEIKNDLESRSSEMSSEDKTIITNAIHELIEKVDVLYSRINVQENEIEECKKVVQYESNKVRANTSLLKYYDQTFENLKKDYVYHKKCAEKVLSELERGMIDVKRSVQLLNANSKTSEELDMLYNIERKIERVMASLSNIEKTSFENENVEGSSILKGPTKEVRFNLPKSGSYETGSEVSLESPRDDEFITHRQYTTEEDDDLIQFSSSSENESEEEMVSSEEESDNSIIYHGSSDSVDSTTDDRVDNNIDNESSSDIQESENTIDKDESVSSSFKEEDDSDENSDDGSSTIERENESIRKLFLPNKRQSKIVNYYLNQSRNTQNKRIPIPKVRAHYLRRKELQSTKTIF